MPYIIRHRLKDAPRYNKGGRSKPHDMTEKEAIEYCYKKNKENPNIHHWYEKVPGSGK